MRAPHQTLGELESVDVKLKDSVGEPPPMLFESSAAMGPSCPSLDFLVARRPLDNPRFLKMLSHDF